jgi:hypothetical protein
MGDRNIDLWPVKRSVVLGFSQREESFVTNLLCQKLQPEEQDKTVNCFHVNAIEGADSLKFHPEYVQWKDQQCAASGLYHLVGAEDFRGKNVYPTLLASILATGFGAYFIAFPLDSFRIDKDEKFKHCHRLVKEINEAIAVIADRVDEGKPCKLTLLGTYQESLQVESLLKKASEQLRGIIYKHCIESPRLKITVNERSDDVVWAIKINVGDDSSNNPLSELAEQFNDKEVYPLSIDWIEAYKHLTTKEGCKDHSDSAARKKCDEILKRTKLNISNFEAMWEAFNYLGWFLMHKEHVFTPPYLCKVIQTLVDRKDQPLWLLTRPITRDLLAERGLAIYFGDSQTLQVMLLSPEKINLSGISMSAAVLYLAIVVDNCIIPISTTQFWKMIVHVNLLKSKAWTYCTIPEFCNYVILRYHLYEVHLLLWHGIVEIAVCKRTVVLGKDHTINSFANKCQKIHGDLCDALTVVSSQTVKTGFACETISEEDKCIQFYTQWDNEYSFHCVRGKHNFDPASFTLKYSVWFLSLENKRCKVSD